MQHHARPNITARLRLSSRSKSSASAGAAGAAAGSAPARLAQNSRKEQLTRPSELSSSNTVRRISAPAADGHLAEEDLPGLSGVVQPGERPAVHLPAEFGGRRGGGRGERARRHHVDRIGESELAEHLPARVQQHRELHARLVDEPLERRLDPVLRDGELHANDSSALSISTRSSPTFARALGDHDDHEFAAPRRAHPAAARRRARRTRPRRIRRPAPRAAPCDRATR